MIRAFIFLMIPSTAFAQAVEPGANPLGTSQYASMLPLLAIFAVFYFLLIRPQQKLRREHQNMIAELKKGDEVVTGGGIFGRVTKVEDNAVTVEIAKGVDVKVVKGTITTVLGKEPAAPTKKNPAVKNDNVVPSKDKIANDN